MWGWGAWAKGRREVNYEPCSMSFFCHWMLRISQKCHSTYNAATCWEKCVPLAGKKCMGLEFRIKPLKLALLSKLSQTQNKSNCVIYLIADENVVLFLMATGDLHFKKKVSFLPPPSASLSLSKKLSMLILAYQRTRTMYFWKFHFPLHDKALRDRTNFF